MNPFEEGLQSAPTPAVQGNIDLYTRPQVQLDTGEYATLLSTSVNVDGMEYLVPTVSDEGTLMSEEEALDTFMSTGRHLGAFKSTGDATMYAKALSEHQNRYYAAFRGETDEEIPFIGVDQFIHYTQSLESEEAKPEMGPWSAAFRDTIAHALGTSVDRSSRFPADPNFNWEESFIKHSDDVPPALWKMLDGASSEEEMLALIDEVNKELMAGKVLTDAGVGGTVLSLLLGIADVDTLIGLGAAGSLVSLGRRATTQSMKGFVGRGALGGAIGGGGYGAGMYAFDPASGIDTVLYGLAAGAGLGSAIGAGVGGWQTGLIKRANEGLLKTVDDVIKVKNSTTPPVAQPAIQEATSNATSVFSLERNDIMKVADGLVDKIPTTKSNSVLGNIVQAVVERLPIASDFDRLFTSAASTAKLAAFTFFESPAGVVRNPITSAVLDSVYQSRILTPAMEAHPTVFHRWARRKGYNFTDRHARSSTSDTFHREVIQEMGYRDLHGKPNPDVDPDIKIFADKLDESMQEAALIARGDQGELSVTGFENILPRTGYFPLIHHGAKIVDQIEKRGDASVRGLLKKAYKSANPEFTDEVINKLADAVIRRGKSKAGDMDTNLYKYFDADHNVFLRQLLEDHGVQPEDIDGLMKNIYPDKADRAKPGYAKHRTPIDITAVGDDGLTMMDIIDTDIPKVMSRYSRDLAGRSALARKGVQNNTQLTEVIDAIVTQDNAMGGKLTHDGVRDMFSHFAGGPLAGGVSEATRRIKQLTNLSLLSQLGLTQMAETGVVMSSIGIGRFMHYSKMGAQVLRDAKQGVMSDLAAELKPWAGSLWNEHLLYRDDLGLDYARHTSGNNTGFWKTIDRGLAKGQRLQGYTSGFYKIKQMQMRTAINGQTDKVLTRLKDNDWSSLRRLEDMGFDEDYLKRIKEKYVDTGVVEWNTKHGFVDKANFAEWETADVNRFAAAIHRHTNQVVQRAMAGETTMWMHKDVGALFTQLQQFPLLAISKQFTRNMRIHDPETLMTMMYGLGTASVAYTMKQLVNGRTDNLDYEQIAKGTFGLSNMTGWVPMMVDPLAWMLGMDELHLGAYGPRSGGPLGVPPSLAVGNRLLGVGRAMSHMGDIKKSDVSALKAIPVFGNMYGMSLLLDSLPESPEDQDRGR